jgi:1-acyl-sn-glycerol-3-phosphate acyltransferase
MNQWPELPPQAPRHQSARAQKFGRWLLNKLGWQIEGQLPPLSKLVVAVAPHTSNWDFIIAMSASLALGVKISFLGKHSIFVWPMRNWLLRWGGIPVRRAQRHGVVEQVVKQFADQPQLILGVSPEGTRKKVTQWRSGFWNIARTAGVPIQLLGLDYAQKKLVFGPLQQPSDHFEQDCQQMRLFFQQMTAKKPEFA